MAEFSLPANSVVKPGKSFPAPDGTRHEVEAAPDVAPDAFYEQMRQRMREVLPPGTEVTGLPNELGEAVAQAQVQDGAPLKGRAGKGQQAPAKPTFARVARAFAAQQQQVHASQAEADAAAVADARRRAEGWLGQATLSEPERLVAAFLQRDSHFWLNALREADVAVMDSAQPGEVFFDEQARVKRCQLPMLERVQRDIFRRNRISHLRRFREIQGHDQRSIGCRNQIGAFVTVSGRFQDVLGIEFIPNFVCGQRLLPVFYFHNLGE